MVFFGVFGVYIIPNWLIKVPGHFGILFRWFWELRKFGQNLDPETSGLSPKCFKKYKKNYGIILEKYYLCQYGTSKKSKFSQFWTHQTPIFFESFLAPPVPQKDKFVQAFSKNLSVVDSWYFRTIIFLKLLKHK